MEYNFKRYYRKSRTSSGNYSTDLSLHNQNYINLRKTGRVGKRLNNISFNIKTYFKRKFNKLIKNSGKRTKSPRVCVKNSAFNNVKVYKVNYCPAMIHWIKYKQETNGRVTKTKTDLGQKDIETVPFLKRNFLNSQNLNTNYNFELNHSSDMRINHQIKHEKNEHSSSALLRAQDKICERKEIKLKSGNNQSSESDELDTSTLAHGFKNQIYYKEQANLAQIHSKIEKTITLLNNIRSNSHKFTKSEIETTKKISNSKIIRQNCDNLSYKVPLNINDEQKPKEQAKVHRQSKPPLPTLNSNYIDQYNSKHEHTVQSETSLEKTEDKSVLFERNPYLVTVSKLKEEEDPVTDKLLKEIEKHNIAYYSYSTLLDNDNILKIKDFTGDIPLPPVHFSRELNINQEEQSYLEIEQDDFQEKCINWLQNNEKAKKVEKSKIRVFNALRNTNVKMNRNEFVYGQKKPNYVEDNFYLCKAKQGNYTPMISEEDKIKNKVYNKGSSDKKYVTSSNNNVGNPKEQNVTPSEDFQKHDNMEFNIIESFSHSTGGYNCIPISETRKKSFFHKTDQTEMNNEKTNCMNLEFSAKADKSEKLELYEKVTNIPRPHTLSVPISHVSNNDKSDNAYHENSLTKDCDNNKILSDTKQKMRIILRNYPCELSCRIKIQESKANKEKMLKNYSQDKDLDTKMNNSAGSNRILNNTPEKVKDLDVVNIQPKPELKLELPKMTHDSRPKETRCFTESTEDNSSMKTLDGAKQSTSGKLEIRKMDIKNEKSAMKLSYKNDLTFTEEHKEVEEGLLQICYTNQQDIQAIPEECNNKCEYKPYHNSKIQNPVTKKPLVTTGEHVKMAIKQPSLSMSKSGEIILGDLRAGTDMLNTMPSITNINTENEIECQDKCTSTISNTTSTSEDLLEKYCSKCKQIMQTYPTSQHLGSASKKISNLEFNTIVHVNLTASRTRIQPKTLTRNIHKTFRQIKNLVQKQKKTHHKNNMQYEKNYIGKKTAMIQTDYVSTRQKFTEQNQTLTMQGSRRNVEQLVNTKDESMNCEEIWMSVSERSTQTGEISLKTSDKSMQSETRFMRMREHMTQTEEEPVCESEKGIQTEQKCMILKEQSIQTVNITMMAREEIVQTEQTAISLYEPVLQTEKDIVCFSEHMIRMKGKRINICDQSIQTLHTTVMAREQIAQTMQTAMNVCEQMLQTEDVCVSEQDAQTEEKCTSMTEQSIQTVDISLIARSQIVQTIQTTMNRCEQMLQTEDVCVSEQDAQTEEKCTSMTEQSIQTVDISLIARSQIVQTIQTTMNRCEQMLQTEDVCVSEQDAQTEEKCTSMTEQSIQTVDISLIARSQIVQTIQTTMNRCEQMLQTEDVCVSEQDAQTEEKCTTMTEQSIQTVDISLIARSQIVQTIQTTMNRCEQMLQTEDVCVSEQDAQTEEKCTSMTEQSIQTVHISLIARSQIVQTIQTTMNRCEQMLQTEDVCVSEQDAQNEKCTNMIQQSIQTVDTSVFAKSQIVQTARNVCEQMLQTEDVCVSEQDAQTEEKCTSMIQQSIQTVDISVFSKSQIVQTARNVCEQMLQTEDVCVSEQDAQTEEKCTSMIQQSIQTVDISLIARSQIVQTVQTAINRCEQILQTEDVSVSEQDAQTEEKCTSIMEQSIQTVAISVFAKSQIVQTARNVCEQMLQTEDVCVSEQDTQTEEKCTSMIQQSIQTVDILVLAKSQIVQTARNVCEQMLQTEDVCFSEHDAQTEKKCTNVTEQSIQTLHTTGMAREQIAQTMQTAMNICEQMQRAEDEAVCVREQVIQTEEKCTNVTEQSIQTLHTTVMAREQIAQTMQTAMNVSEQMQRAEDEAVCVREQVIQTEEKCTNVTEQSIQTLHTTVMAREQIAQTMQTAMNVSEQMQQAEDEAVCVREQIIQTEEKCTSVTKQLIQSVDMPVIARSQFVQNEQTPIHVCEQKQQTEEITVCINEQISKTDKKCMNFCDEGIQAVEIMEIAKEQIAQYEEKCINVLNAAIHEHTLQKNEQAIRACEQMVPTEAEAVHIREQVTKAEQIRLANIPTLKSKFVINDLCIEPSQCEIDKGAFESCLIPIATLENVLTDEITFSTDEVSISQVEMFKHRKEREQLKAKCDFKYDKEENNRQYASQDIQAPKKSSSVENSCASLLSSMKRSQTQLQSTVKKAKETILKYNGFFNSDSLFDEIAEEEECEMNTNIETCLGGCESSTTQPDLSTYHKQQQCQINPMTLQTSSIFDITNQTFSIKNQNSVEQSSYNYEYVAKAPNYTQQDSGKNAVSPHPEALIMSNQMTLKEAKEVPQMQIQCKEEVQIGDQCSENKDIRKNDYTRPCSVILNLKCRQLFPNVLRNRRYKSSKLNKSAGNKSNYAVKPEMHWKRLNRFDQKVFKGEKQKLQLQTLNKNKFWKIHGEKEKQHIKSSDSEKYSKYHYRPRSARLKLKSRLQPEALRSTRISDQVKARSAIECRQNVTDRKLNKQSKSSNFLLKYDSTQKQKRTRRLHYSLPHSNQTSCSINVWDYFGKSPYKIKYSGNYIDNSSVRPNKKKSNVRKLGKSEEHKCLEDIEDTDISNSDRKLPQYSTEVLKPKYFRHRSNSERNLVKTGNKNTEIAPKHCDRPGSLKIKLKSPIPQSKEFQYSARITQLKTKSAVEFEHTGNGRELKKETKSSSYLSNCNDKPKKQQKSKSHSSVPPTNQSSCSINVWDYFTRSPFKVTLDEDYVENLLNSGIQTVTKNDNEWVRKLSKSEEHNCLEDIGDVDFPQSGTNIHSDTESSILDIPHLKSASDYSTSTAELTDNELKSPNPIQRSHLGTANVIHAWSDNITNITSMSGQKKKLFSHKVPNNDMVKNQNPINTNINPQRKPSSGSGSHILTSGVHDAVKFGQQHMIQKTSDYVGNKKKIERKPVNKSHQSPNIDANDRQKYRNQGSVKKESKSSNYLLKNNSKSRKQPSRSQSCVPPKDQASHSINVWDYFTRSPFRVTLDEDYVENLLNSNIQPNSKKDDWIRKLPKSEEYKCLEDVGDIDFPQPDNSKHSDSESCIVDIPHLKSASCSSVIKSSSDESYFSSKSAKNYLNDATPNTLPPSLSRGNVIQAWSDNGTNGKFNSRRKKIVERHVRSNVLTDKAYALRKEQSKKYNDIVVEDLSAQVFDTTVTHLNPLPIEITTNVQNYEYPPTLDAYGVEHDRQMKYPTVQGPVQFGDITVEDLTTQTFDTTNVHLMPRHFETNNSSENDYRKPNVGPSAQEIKRPLKSEDALVSSEILDGRIIRVKPLHSLNCSKTSIDENIENTASLSMQINDQMKRNMEHTLIKGLTQYKDVNQSMSLASEKNCTSKTKLETDSTNDNPNMTDHSITIHNQHNTEKMIDNLHSQKIVINETDETHSCIKQELPQDDQQKIEGESTMDDDINVVRVKSLNPLDDANTNNKQGELECSSLFKEVMLQKFRMEGYSLMNKDMNYPCTESENINRTAGLLNVGKEARLSNNNISSDSSTSTGSLVTIKEFSSASSSSLETFSTFSSTKAKQTKTCFRSERNSIPEMLTKLESILSKGEGKTVLNQKLNRAFIPKPDNQHNSVSGSSEKF